MREKHREQLLRTEGWWVVRWTMADLRDPVGFRRIIEAGRERAAVLIPSVFVAVPCRTPPARTGSGRGRGRRRPPA